jgi:lysophospholipase L1-like esterase
MPARTLFRFPFALVVCLLAAAVPTWSDASAFADGLKDGQRVVFLGDSITQAGAGPGGYVTLVREAIAKRRPNAGIEVVGAGISGNRVPDLEKRLERDVLEKKPDVVVIYIGINDVWHSLRGRGTPKDEFEQGLHRLIEQIRKATGATVVLCTPSVIGEKTDGSNQLDEMLEEYAAIGRKVALAEKIPLLDLRKAFLSHLKGHNPNNAEKGVLTTDGVHLNATGNQFVASQMLTALGEAGEQAQRVLRHFVLFKFNEEVTPEQIDEVVTAFQALPSRIDLIIDFETGTDVSVENKAAGFTHGFLVTFRDEKGRDAYLPHPAHQEFGKLARPRLDKVLVFDYWSER